jgi:hypothetical protein
MRFAVALLAVAAAVGCAKKEEPAPDSAAMAAPAAPTVADYAGTWNISSVLEGTPDTVKSTITVSPDGSCNLTLEGRPNVACTTSMSGDSLVTQSAEYESVLRKGVKVTVRTAAVMSGGAMNGTLIANYKMPTGDQVVNGTITGTKAP